MINLAGVKHCDDYITVELEKAGVIIEDESWEYGEVPYSITGKLHNWKLKRAWRYWIAISDDSKGLSVKDATVMHEKNYPDHMFDHKEQYGKYGYCVRVAGHAGCPHPDGIWEDGGYINSYHIDTQEGLNEFVRTVKEANKPKIDLVKECNIYNKSLDTFNDARIGNDYNELVVEHKVRSFLNGMKKAIEKLT